MYVCMYVMLFMCVVWLGKSCVYAFICMCVCMFFMYVFLHVYVHMCNINFTHPAMNKCLHDQYLLVSISSKSCRGTMFFYNGS
jgi:hypothetical protein